MGAFDIGDAGASAANNLRRIREEEEERKPAQVDSFTGQPLSTSHEQPSIVPSPEPQRLLPDNKMEFVEPTPAPTQTPTPSPTIHPLIQDKLNKNTLFDKLLKPQEPEPAPDPSVPEVGGVAIPDDDPTEDVGQEVTDKQFEDEVGSLKSFFQSDEQGKKALMQSNPEGLLGEFNLEPTPENINLARTLSTKATPEQFATAMNTLGSGEDIEFEGDQEVQASYDRAKSVSSKAKGALPTDLPGAIQATLERLDAAGIKADNELAQLISDFEKEGPQGPSILEQAITGFAPALVSTALGGVEAGAIAAESSEKQLLKMRELFQKSFADLRNKRFTSRADRIKSRLTAEKSAASLLFTGVIAAQKGDIATAKLANDSLKTKVAIKLGQAKIAEIGTKAEKETEKAIQSSVRRVTDQFFTNKKSPPAENIKKINGLKDLKRMVLLNNGLTTAVIRSRIVRTIAGDVGNISVQEQKAVEGMQSWLAKIERLGVKAFTREGGLPRADQKAILDLIGVLEKGIVTDLQTSTERLINAEVVASKGVIKDTEGLRKRIEEGVGIAEFSNIPRQAKANSHVLRLSAAMDGDPAVKAKDGEVFEVRDPKTGETFKIRKKINKDLLTRGREFDPAFAAKFASDFEEVK